jgi:hypothetical protein
LWKNIMAASASVVPLRQPTTEQALRDRIAELEEQVRQLQALLTGPIDFPIQIAARHRRVLGCLYRRSPNPVASEIIISAAWRDDDVAACPETLRTTMLRLRRSLVRYGIEIEGYFGFGYGLPVASRDRLKAMVGAAAP